MKKIAVITPYYNEPLDVLFRCYKSVLEQDVDVDHFLIADGLPRAELAELKLKHIVLPTSHGDNGNTPRGIGSLLADVEGYDFISYLDADNWFHPNHLQSLLDLHYNTQADVCTSFRTFHDNNGTNLGISDPEETNLQHVDTSCMLLHRNSFEMLQLWMKMPRQLSPICDRVFLKGLIFKRFKIHSSRLETVAFRTQYPDHYRMAGIAPPPNSKVNDASDAYKWLLSVDGARETTQRIGFFPG